MAAVKARMTRSCSARDMASHGAGGSFNRSKLNLADGIPAYLLASVRQWWLQASSASASRHRLLGSGGGLTQ